MQRCSVLGGLHAATRGQWGQWAAAPPRVPMPAMASPSHLHALLRYPPHPPVVLFRVGGVQLQRIRGRAAAGRARLAAGNGQDGCATAAQRSSSAATDCGGSAAQLPVRQRQTGRCSRADLRRLWVCWACAVGVSEQRLQGGRHKTCRLSSGASPTLRLPTWPVLLAALRSHAATLLPPQRACQRRPCAAAAAPGWT